MKSKYYEPTVLVIALICLTLSALFIMIEIKDVKDLLNYCKDNGFDGVRYEEVNFFQDEPKCAMFTTEDKYIIEKNKEFNEAGEEVFNSLFGRNK